MYFDGRPPSLWSDDFHGWGQAPARTGTVAGWAWPIDVPVWVDLERAPTAAAQGVFSGLRVLDAGAGNLEAQSPLAALQRAIATSTSGDLAGSGEEDGLALPAGALDP